MKKAGFSLVELMVVIGLVGILSVAISSMVLTTILQVGRIRNQIRVRQSGDYALGQLQTMIRNARQVIACDSLGNTIEIVNPDGNTTLFLSEMVGDANIIASNSGQYLTSTDTTIEDTLDIECLPDDTSPKLIKISFDLQRYLPDAKPKENVNLHYETSIEIRND